MNAIWVLVVWSGFASWIAICVWDSSEGDVRIRSKAWVLSIFCGIIWPLVLIFLLTYKPKPTIFGGGSS